MLIEGSSSMLYDDEKHLPAQVDKHILKYQATPADSTIKMIKVEKEEEEEEKEEEEEEKEEEETELIPELNKQATRGIYFLFMLSFISYLNIFYCIY